MRFVVFGFSGVRAATASFCAVMTVPAFAVDNIGLTDVSDLTSGRAKIADKDYADALTELCSIAEDSQQADVYHLMGFTFCTTGDFNRH